MVTETVLRANAIDLLIKAFGVLDAERFITSIKSNNFDWSRRGTYPAPWGEKRVCTPECNFSGTTTYPATCGVVDYTEWHKNLWKDKTIDEIHKMATEFENRKYWNV